MANQKNQSIGIDIGGTNISIGAVDKFGGIIQQWGFKTAEVPTPEAFIEKVQATIGTYFKEHKNYIQGIGVGAPNGNYYKGTIEFAPNLKWQGNIPMVEMLQAAFGCKVILTNDANAAAIGEMEYGAAKGMKNFIMITLGTGVGSGFVANGEVIYGHDGFAGEFGHTNAIRDGRQCGCGKKGCLETYASATGIVRTIKEFLEKDDRPSLLRNFVNPTAKDIYDAACQDDEVALEIFDFTGKILGQSLADAVAITSPKSIILFGGLAGAKKYIFDPTVKYLNANLLKIWQGKINVIPSELPESDAAVLGAAGLVWARQTTFA
jgi:glucokinase